MWALHVCFHAFLTHLCFYYPYFKWVRMKWQSICLRETVSVLQSRGDLFCACLLALRETLYCLWGNAMKREKRLVVRSYVKVEQELWSAVVSNFWKRRDSVSSRPFEELTIKWLTIHRRRNRWQKCIDHVNFALVQNVEFEKGHPLSSWRTMVGSDYFWLFLTRFWCGHN